MDKRGYPQSRPERVRSLSQTLAAPGWLKRVINVKEIHNKRVEQSLNGGHKKAACKRLICMESGRTKQTRTADPHHVKVVL